MIKKKITLAALTMLLGIGVLVGSSNSLTAEASKEGIVSFHGLVHPFEELCELEKNAPIIVQATFSGERETIESNLAEGRVFRSDSIVEIKKVYKGDLKKKDRITVYEPAIVNEDNTYFTINGYSLMNEEGKYTLFLSPVENWDGYAIVGIYQGKFDSRIKGKGQTIKQSSSPEDLTDVDYLGEDVEQFNKLKEQVNKKYKWAN